MALSLRRETAVLYLAVRDPRTPRAARLLAAAVVAYALSPIDLIPDFIPFVGYLDDMILVPLGIALCLRLIPEHVLAEARERAQRATETPPSHVAATIIVLLWAGALAALSVWVYRAMSSGA